MDHRVDVGTRKSLIVSQIYVPGAPFSVIWLAWIVWPAAMDLGYVPLRVQASE